MQVINKGIIFKTECIYEKEVVEPGKKAVEVYKGFKNEGTVVDSNMEEVKKGDTVQVNPWGGSEVTSLATKKHKFLVIEARDVLVKL